MFRQRLKAIFSFLLPSDYNWGIRVVKHLLLLYALTFLMILPYLCHDMPQSMYYTLCTSNDTAENNLLHENNRRITEASEILQQLDDLGYSRLGLRQQNGSRGAVTIAATVMTISRNQLVQGDAYSPKYLTQVTADLLDQIRRYEQHSNHLHMDLSLCNGDKTPSEHTEAVHLSKYLPMFTETPEKDENLHVKEAMKRGYVYCLRQMLAMDADFVFLIEDDAVPLPDMMKVLSMIIDKYLTDRRSDTEPAISSWRSDKTAFIKFHHPERLLKFINLDPERIPELLSFGVCLSCALTLLYCLADYKNKIHHNIHWLWSMFFIYTVLVCLCVGRTNLIEFHRIFPPYLYYLTRSPSCCTQAVLYPRTHVPRIISELDKIQCNKSYASDDALDDIVHREGLYSYLVQPNVFKNIGLYSALRREKISPYLIA